MKIEILGDGCFRCDRMYENVLEAVRLSGKEADVIKTMDIQKIADTRVRSMPAMIIDGVVKGSGKIPAVSEILAPSCIGRPAGNPSDALECGFH